jgi:3-oxoacyl-[acyl-carrier-protein] synthase-3
MNYHNKTSIITGYGAYLPKKILSNHDLSDIVETNDEWIIERTGIKFRHIADSDETTSDMAVHASKLALEHAQIDISKIDLIIVATTTPDYTFPSVATIVQHKLSLITGAAFDVQAVCAGFVFALSIADNYIKSGQAENILVVGADKMSNIVDWSDRKTCVLFGDGAGAVVLSKKPANDSGDSGIIGTIIKSDGRFTDILCTTGGAATDKNIGTILMEGKEVFRHAVEKMSSITQEILAKNNLSIADIDYLVPHQANIRILLSVAKKLTIPEDKVVVTVDKHANTSAASIPLALAAAHHKFKTGNLVLITAIGGGLAWGACLIRI